MSRKCGVREARERLTNLLACVRKGGEVVTTRRGHPVARLVPIKSEADFPDLKRVRLQGRAFRPKVSQAVLEDREDDR